MRPSRGFRRGGGLNTFRSLLLEAIGSDMALSGTPRGCPATGSPGCTLSGLCLTAYLLYVFWYQDGSRDFQSISLFALVL